MSRVFVLLFILLASLSTAFGQGNGKLQIHFIDVGQGDAALLISPKGETVLFDDGVARNCNRPVSYLQQLGITKIDYLIASHYHDDHIGCTSEVLTAFPLSNAAYDRGYSFPSQLFKQYEKAVGTKRKTAIIGNKIILDSNTDHPVSIEFIALNGAGVTTTNENSLSLVSVIRFGMFDAVMGGDLSGFNTNDYKDIESVVADKVGKVEVYKVHQHCSSYSSNDKWLSVVNPKVGIISASGDIGRNQHHPTQECLERLHKANVKTYWTESGGGAEPEPTWDVVSRKIIVEADPNKDEFKITYNWNDTDTYPLWESVNTKVVADPLYAWSKNSKVYHYVGCKYVSNMSPANLVKGSTPPAGMRLHDNCQ
jgi:competence protein ComEC